MARLFSDTVMTHFLHPHHAGFLSKASGEGWSGSIESSRYMRIQVKLEGDQIVEARFGTHGCAPAIAAGDYLCAWATGKTVAQAQSMTADELNQALGGLPPARRFCANLAVDALQAAFSNCFHDLPNVREETFP